MQSINEEKKRLRAVMKERRGALSEEQLIQANRAVFEHAAAFLREYKPQQLLCYVSAPPLEVDTRQLIQLALDSGVIVAVPKCTDRRGEMIFYRIKSLSQLVSGSYGIEEPDPAICPKADIKAGGLCIVPALAFDRRGYRLGFGGGYYDRFLVGSGGMKVGLCFECCLEETLPTDRFDIKVDAVITERGICRF